MALNLSFEEADLNPPSTSGRTDVSFEDIFTNLGDLPGSYPDNMAGESITQMARRNNTERMAARRKAEADQSEPPPRPLVTRAESSPSTLVEEMAQIDTTEMELIVDQQNSQVTEHRRKKRPAEQKADSSENLTNKRPRMEESDLIVLFIIQPKIKNISVASDASPVKDATVV